MLIKFKTEDNATGRGPVIYCTQARAGGGQCSEADVRLVLHAELDEAWAGTFAALLCGRLLQVRGPAGVPGAVAFARCGSCGASLGFDMPAPADELELELEPDVDQVPDVDRVPAEQQLELGERSQPTGGGVMLKQWIRPNARAALHMLVRPADVTAAGRAVVEAGLEIAVEAIDASAVAITISDAEEDLDVRIVARELVLEQLDDMLRGFPLAAYLAGARPPWGESPAPDEQLEAVIKVHPFTIGAPEFKGGAR